MNIMLHRLAIRFINRGAGYTLSEAKFIFVILILPAFVFPKFGLWFEYRYDSNVCSLGKSEVNGFLAGVDDYGIASIDDDVIVSGIWFESPLSIAKKSVDEPVQRGQKSTKSKRKLKLKKFVKISLGARCVGTFYSRNFEKSSLLSETWAKFSWKKFGCDLSLSYVPRSSTRPYIPLDEAERKWAVYSSFSTDISPSFEIFKKMSIGFFVGIQKYWYIEAFRNYNSFALSVGPRIKWQDLTLGWNFTSSSADGRDIPDATDISYRQDDFSAGFSRGVKILGVSFSPGVEVNYSRRFYTSRKPLWVDPLHLGRWEEKWDVSSQISTDIGKNWTVRTKLIFTSRAAHSEWKPEVNGLRSYEKSEVSIRVSKKF